MRRGLTIYLPLDGAADAALFGSTTGLWTFRHSQTGAVQTWGPWGNSADVRVPADYTGDNRTDCSSPSPSEARERRARASGGGVPTV